MTNPTPAIPVANLTPSAIPAQDGKTPVASVIAPAVKPETIVQPKV
jgi:hypothetical protein